MKAAERCFDTLTDKAVDDVLRLHEYTGAAVAPGPDGSVTVEAEKRVGYHGRVRRLTAVIDANGAVLSAEEETL